MFNMPFKKSQAPQTDSAELEYEDLLKVEFLDMIDKFQQDRTVFHIYAIGRCATTATLVGFSYNYKVKQRNHENYILKTIDLKEYGKLEFEIKSGENYGTIVTKNRQSIVQNLIDNFPTQTKVTSFSNSNMN